MQKELYRVSFAYCDDDNRTGSGFLEDVLLSEDEKEQVESALNQAVDEGVIFGDFYIGPPQTEPSSSVAFFETLRDALADVEGELYLEPATELDGEIYQAYILNEYGAWEQPSFLVPARILAMGNYQDIIELALLQQYGRKYFAVLNIVPDESAPLESLTEIHTWDEYIP